MFRSVGRQRSLIPPLGTRPAAGSSPYARGLIRAWVMNRNAGDVGDLVAGQTLVSQTVSTWGQGQGIAGGHYLEETVIPSATWTPAFSVVLVFSNYSGANGTALFGNRNSGASGFGLYNIGGFLSFSNIGLADHPTSIPIPVTNLTTQVTAVSFDGSSTATVMLNGRTEAIGVSSPAASLNGMVVGGAYAFAAGGFVSTLRVQAVYVYNRALSSQELAAIGVAPWLPLQPQVRRTYIFTADAGGGSVPKTASDTASISAADARAIAAALSRSDAASLSVSEAKVLLATLARTDTASFSATEATALLALLARTDTASLSATEAKALLVLLARGDTASLTVSEVAAIIILTLKAASDTARLAVTESASIQMALVKTASDTASLTVTEARALLALVARADSAGVAVTESRGPIAVSLTRADGAAISATEAKAILVALARGDAASISAAEAHALLVGFGRADLAALTTTSAAVIVSTTVGEAYLVIFTADALAAPSAMVGDALMAPSTVSGDLLE